MLQQEKNIGFNNMEQVATLPHNVCNFCDRNLEIESSLATRNIIGHHFRQTILLEALYAICEEGEAQEHVISVGASTVLQRTSTKKL